MDFKDKDGSLWDKLRQIAWKLVELRDRTQWELEKQALTSQGKETPGERGEDEANQDSKPAYQFKVKGQNVWCNDKGPFKAEPRLSAILGELINNPEVEVKMKRLKTVSGLNSSEAVCDTVRDIVAWLNDTFKADTKRLDKMFEPVRGKNRKYTGYIYHPNIS